MAISQTTFQILKKTIELHQLMQCFKMKCFNALFHLHSCSLKERFQIPGNNLSSNSNFNPLILFFCKRGDIEDSILPQGHQQPHEQ